METEYVFTFRNGIIYTDDLIKFFYDRKFSERQTFIWIIRPSDWTIQHLKNAEGQNIVQFHKELKIYLLFDRPVFYDPDIQKGQYIFREYKP